MTRTEFPLWVTRKGLPFSGDKDRVPFRMISTGFPFWVTMSEFPFQGARTGFLFGDYGRVSFLGDLVRVSFSGC